MLDLSDTPRPPLRAVDSIGFPNINSAALVPFVTFFPNYAAKSKRERVMPLAELADLIRTTSAPAKDQLLWLKLARFGNALSPKGGLCWDTNVIACSGIEADYDGEEIGLDHAIEKAEKAGLLALFYTSPSHTPVRSRWRILCTASREFPKEDRRKYMGRINGLYGGIFARESWTLSQSYYFGRVGEAPAHRVELVDGQSIDRLDALDQIWKGPPATRSHRPAGGTTDDGSSELRGDAELIRCIVTGEHYHVELCALAGRYIGRGMNLRDVAEVLRGLMLAHPENERDVRWRDRYRQVPELVRSAAQKFALEAEKRRAIAALTHKLMRQRRDGPQIKAAILAEAERSGLDAKTALAIGAAIRRQKLGGQRHA